MKFLISIIALGIVLRLISLNQSLWLDEAISALAARDFSYLGIVFEFLKIDNHPPLFYLLLKFWGQVFGFIDLHLRFLPVVLGSALVLVVYKITFELTKKPKVALVSALLTSMSPVLVYYSQEIRMYILITLLCGLQIFVFQLILKKESLLKWITFSLLNCLLFFSDYITVFFFPVLILYPLLVKDSKLFKKTLLSFLPLLLLFILWYPYFDAQLLKNKELVSIFPGWGSVVGGATFKNLIVAWMKFVAGRISFDPKSIYYGLVAASSLPILIALYLAKIRKNLLIWLWLAIPVFLGFTFSFIIPVFNYFRFIYVVPAVLILVAIGISNTKKYVRISLISLIILTNSLSLGIYYLDPAQQRENWRQIVSFLETNATDKDLVVFEFQEPFAPYRFYATGKIDAIGATDSYFADKEKTSEKLSTNLKGKTGVYHFEYLRDLSDPQKFVEQKLTSEGFAKNKIYNDFYNIGQVSYWQK